MKQSTINSYLLPLVAAMALTGIFSAPVYAVTGLTTDATVQNGPSLPQPTVLGDKVTEIDETLDSATVLVDRSSDKSACKRIRTRKRRCSTPP